MKLEMLILKLQELLDTVDAGETYMGELPESLDEMEVQLREAVRFLKEIE